MGITPSRNEETFPFLASGNYPSIGGWLNSKSGALNATVCYYDRLDVVIQDWNNATPFPDSESWCRWDPLFLNNGGTLFDAVAEPGTIGGLNNQYIAKGHWNRVTNEQKVYVYAGGSGRPFNEVSPLVLNNVLQLDAFPNLGSLASRNGLITGDPFFYNFARGWWLFFEGYGKAICINCDVWDAGGVQKDNVMAEVDLVTGNATIVPSPVGYGTATHEFAEAPLLGQVADFFQGQFIPDDDDEPARPKGVLYLWSEMRNNPLDSLLLRGWMKIIDWNPTAKSGTPSRTHLRERLLTATDLTKSTPAAVDGVHETGTIISYEWVYHPRSNQLVICSNTTSGVQLAANQQKLLYFRATPSFDKLTEPSARTTIATGKTVPFGITALGSLNEPILGVSVQFSIQNESTVDEVLATTPTPGETVTLANTVNPLDASASPITVKKDGVAMVEGGGAGEYSLNRPASQITFNAPEPVGGSVYTGSYRHFDDPQSSPHGALLQQFAATDADGEAVTRVRYPEETPVSDRWDRLTAVDV